MTQNEMRRYIYRQIQSIYGLTETDEEYMEKYFGEAVLRTLECFSHIKNKYYVQNKINFYHSVQYLIFLYYLSNSIYKNEIKNCADYLDYRTNARMICDKLYCLNKLMSSCEIYYEIELPKFFFAEHPLGSVIGRAKIGKGFCFMQSCTVGNNAGFYPIIGEYVFMYSGAKILGNAHIGNRVLIAANTYIKDQDVPDDVIVFGASPNLIIKKNYLKKIKGMIMEQFCL